MSSWPEGWLENYWLRRHGRIPHENRVKSQFDSNEVRIEYEILWDRVELEMGYCIF